MSSILRKFGGGASEHPRRQGPGSKTGNHKGWGPLAFRKPAVHSLSTARRIAFVDNLLLRMRRCRKSANFPRSYSQEGWITARRSDFGPNDPAAMRSKGRTAWASEKRGDPNIVDFIRSTSAASHWNP